MKMHLTQKTQLVEKHIEALIANLNFKNKAECLSLIMSLEPEYRMTHLNNLIKAVHDLGEEKMVELLSAA